MKKKITVLVFLLSVLGFFEPRLWAATWGEIRQPWSVVNVRALTDLSLAFIEPLERRKGGILNVASVAAFLPGPGMAVYYATKAYVLSVSEALHRELAPRGVRVTALCPGPVPSEFQARAGVRHPIYPPVVTQSAARVAELAYRGLAAGRRLVVPGLVNRLAATFMRFIPRRKVLLRHY